MSVVVVDCIAPPSEAIPHLASPMHVCHSAVLRRESGEGEAVCARRPTGWREGDWGVPARDLRRPGSVKTRFSELKRGGGKWISMACYIHLVHCSSLSLSPHSLQLIMLSIYIKSQALPRVRTLYKTCQPTTDVTAAPSSSSPQSSKNGQCRADRARSGHSNK